MPVDPDAAPVWATFAEVARTMAVNPATLTVEDADELEACTAAANQYIYRRRAEAGYTADLPATAPGPDVTRAVVLYAVALWRERGSVDSFASFADFTPSPVTGSMGQILKLAGVPRPVAV